MADAKSSPQGASSPITISIDNVGQAYLELLKDRGIKYFFGNAGTDFAPLVDGFARFAAEKKDFPQPVLVPHEFTAVSMAHGFAMVTGEPQVVMVHVNVGTSNGLTGVMNASRAGIPLIFTAGRTPITEGEMKGGRNLHIHWAQESFDQASMLREYVKWDYELRNFTQLEKVVDRALNIAMSEPKGPVYLSLPREVLAEEHREFTYTPSGPRLYAKPGPDAEAIRQAAELLRDAENPLVITSMVGKNPAAVGELVKLCESFAIPVVMAISNLYLNFPSDHPLHLGFDPMRFVETADVILVIECDVPWFPIKVKPKPEAKVIQMGIDPYFSRYPMRTFPVDVPIASDPEAGLRSLREALSFYKAKKQPGKPWPKNKAKLDPSIWNGCLIAWEKSGMGIRCSSMNTTCGLIKFPSRNRGPSTDRQCPVDSAGALERPWGLNWPGQIVFRWSAWETERTILPPPLPVISLPKTFP